MAASRLRSLRTKLARQKSRDTATLSPLSRPSGDGCRIKFHASCVSIDEADVPLYAASGPDKKVFICPWCYDKNKPSAKRKKEKDPDAKPSNKRPRDAREMACEMATTPRRVAVDESSSIHVKLKMSPITPGNPSRKRARYLRAPSLPPSFLTD